MSDTATKPAFSMDELVSLCKRRGFIYPASEIYGGLNGFWDYGPLGTALKNNLRDRWWRDMVKRPPMGVESEIRGWRLEGGVHCMKIGAGANILQMNPPEYPPKFRENLRPWGWPNGGRTDSGRPAGWRSARSPDRGGGPTGGGPRGGPSGGGLLCTHC